MIDRACTFAASQYMRIADDDEPVVRLPRLEHERAARDDVLRLRPLLAVRFDGFPRDRPEELMRDEPGKKRHRLREGVFERVVVDGRDADILGFPLAFVVGLRALDVVREIRRARRQLGREAAPQRIDEIVRRDADRRSTTSLREDKT